MLIRTLVLILTLSACVSDDTGSTGGPNPPPPPPPGTDGGTCPQSVVTAPTTASCAKATQTCIDACPDTDDGTCWDNCVAADPAAEDCTDCLDDAYNACANAAGCQSAYDAMECCAATCADPDSDDCYTVTCATESNAYDACTDNTECDDDPVCFKAM